VPTIMALRTRIHIEERMLSDAFGQRYEAFCASRWRLIPWVY
jgi:protein-S-isoprenylcysteine O-methyltransferase Ste14